MDINIKVTGQTLIPTNIRDRKVVAGTQEFIRFVFALDEEWASLTVFAQFTQNSAAYSVYLDSDGAAYLPAEIITGAMTVALQGNSGNTIAKSMPLNFRVFADPISSDSSSTNITLTLYDQLVADVQATAESIVEDAIEEMNETISSSISDAATEAVNAATEAINAATEAANTATKTANAAVEAAESATASAKEAAEQMSIYDEDNDVHYTYTLTVKNGHLGINLTKVDSE